MTTNNETIVSAVTESTEIKLGEITHKEFLKLKHLPYMRKRCTFKESIYPYTYLIAMGSDNTVKGVIVFVYYVPKRRIHIYLMEVVARSKGKGYGRKMFEALENLINKYNHILKAEVITLRCEKEPSGFWKKMGFNPTEDMEYRGDVYNNLSFFSKKITG